MGLKLYFDHRGEMSLGRAIAVVRRLHEVARQLPFDSVSPVRRLTEEDRRWSQHVLQPPGAGSTIDVPALEGAWFVVETNGAESLRMGLATRPATVEIDGEDVETTLAGECSWHDGAKTQYAGLPAHGGELNFMRAHLSIVALLDESAALGLTVDVRDDSGYWRHRDVDRLLAELHRHNCEIAALGGLLIDAGLGEGLEAPILSHPRFEHLEAEGRGRLWGG